MTQHRTAAWNVIVSLFWLRIVKTDGTSSSNIEGFGGIPGPEAYQIKMIRPTSTLAPYKFTSKKGKFSRLERLYQTRKLKLAFQKYKLWNSFFKLQLQNWKTSFFRAPIFKFYLLSPISALLLPTCSTSGFQKLVEKVRNYIKEFWLILKKWIWRIDFERFSFFFEKKSVLPRKMG